MNHSRRNIVIGFLFVSILGTLSHFFYQWSGKNSVIGLFAPVNESTWEHMKLIFFPSVVYLFFLYLKSNTTPELLTALPFGIFCGTFLVPILFYTYTGILGSHYLILDLTVFFISAAAVFYIAYKSANASLLQKHTALFPLLLVFLAGCFVVFTYRPPQIELFLNP